MNPKDFGDLISSIYTPIFWFCTSEADLNVFLAHFVNNWMHYYEIWQTFMVPGGYISNKLVILYAVNKAYWSPSLSLSISMVGMISL